MRGGVRGVHAVLLLILLISGSGYGRIMHMKLSDSISDWIKEKVLGAGCRGVVFGLSGGLDSAVVALLCKKAFPVNCLALILPCNSLREDVIQAEEFAADFGIKHKEIELSNVFGSLCKKLEGEPCNNERELHVANLKPRLRMAALYYYAQKMNYLVIGTGNRSELMMGYFTKYGDGGVDLLPIGGLLKTEVRELAKELGVPKELIEKAPSAGLWHGQTDEAEMGITYAELDRVLLGKLDGIDEERILLVRERVKKSEHKRRSPEIYK